MVFIVQSRIVLIVFVIWNQQHHDFRPFEKDNAIVFIYWNQQHHGFNALGKDNAIVSNYWK
jgi:hypothetical protein